MPMESHAVSDPRDHLLKNDSEFRKLYDEHRTYDSRLVELSEKRHLSQEEIVEEVELKKKKLHLKDRMEQKIRAVHTS